VQLSQIWPNWPHPLRPQSRPRAGPERQEDGGKKQGQDIFPPHFIACLVAVPDFRGSRVFSHFSRTPYNFFGRNYSDLLGFGLVFWPLAAPGFAT
jgi:hypothetical protein